MGATGSKTSDPSHPPIPTSHASLRAATTPNRSTATSPTPSGSDMPTAAATTANTSTPSATHSWSTASPPPPTTPTRPARRLDTAPEPGRLSGAPNRLRDKVRCNPDRRRVRDRPEPRPATQSRGSFCQVFPLPRPRRGGRKPPAPGLATGARTYLSNLGTRTLGLWGAAAGAGGVEIAWRFRRTPKNVRQVIAFSQLPRNGGPRPSPNDRLRPIERRVLRWREEGADFADLAARFCCRGLLEQVEQLARYKLAR